MEVHYAKMEKYSQIIELNEDQTNLKIRVMDTSESSLHKDFIKWLKVTNRR